jgi:hypothetical protein
LPLSAGNVSETVRRSRNIGSPTSIITGSFSTSWDVKENLEVNST